MNKLEKEVKSKASTINELIKRVHFVQRNCSRSALNNTANNHHIGASSQDIVKDYSMGDVRDSLFKNAFSEFDNWDAWDKNY